MQLPGTVGRGSATKRPPGRGSGPCQHLSRWVEVTRVAPSGGSVIMLGAPPPSSALRMRPDRGRADLHASQLARFNLWIRVSGGELARWG